MFSRENHVKSFENKVIRLWNMSAFQIKLNVKNNRIEDKIRKVLLKQLNIQILFKNTIVACLCCRVSYQQQL